MVLAGALIYFKSALILNWTTEKEVTVTVLVIKLADVIENNDILSHFSLNVSIIDCTDFSKKFQELLISRLGNLHEMMTIDSINPVHLCFCSQHLCKSPEHLFLLLPLCAIIALFSHDSCLITCEMEVLRLLIKWIIENKPVVMEDLLKYVTIINKGLKNLDWFQLTAT